MSYDVVQEVVDNIVSGKSTTASESYLLQRHLNKFYMNQLVYVSRQNKHTLLRNTVAKFPLFGAFDDPDRYAGHVPSAQYLSSLIEKYFQTNVYTSEGLPAGNDNLTREQYLQRRQQTIRGQIWSADESYKLANLCYLKTSSNVPLSATAADTSSTRPISSIFTVFNEKAEVVLQKLLTTTSRAELKTELKRCLQDRYRAFGFPLPIIYYTDNCCKDASLLNQVLDELAESDSLFSGQIHLPSPNTIAPLDLVSIPNDHQQFIAAYDSRELLNYVEELREISLQDGVSFFGAAAGEEKGFVAMDIEWDPCTLHGVTDTDPALLQLSVGKMTLLVRLRIGNRKPRKLPQCLLNLLFDKRLTFVGNFIKGDITRLSNAYEFDKAKVAFCDLSREAIRCNYHLDNSALSYLSRRFLQKELPKESKVRLSRWSQPQLTPEQIKYAVLDAFVSYEIFKVIKTCGDPRLDPPPNQVPDPGTPVLLFTANKAECVAMGWVTDHQSDEYEGLKLHPSGRSRRVVVELDPTSIYVPRALSEYPSQRGGKRLRLSDCKTVMWDLDCLRLDSPLAQQWRESLHDTVGSIDDLFKASATDSDLSDSDPDDFFTKISSSSSWVEVSVTDNNENNFDGWLADFVEEDMDLQISSCKEDSDPLIIVKGM
jgi:hypothetical protein